MNDQPIFSQQVRPMALVFIASILIAAGLRAGEIHDAAVAGDLNKVCTLLESDPTLLESRDHQGNTPLISTCINRQVAVANFLLDKGADVNARGSLRFTIETVTGHFAKPRRPIL
jgi:ankyrin repeat protein